MDRREFVSGSTAMLGLSAAGLSLTVDLNEIVPDKPIRFLRVLQDNVLEDDGKPGFRFTAMVSYEDDTTGIFVKPESVKRVVDRCVQQAKAEPGRFAIQIS
jgi:hypothetical protein